MGSQNSDLLACRQLKTTVGNDACVSLIIKTFDSNVYGAQWAGGSSGQLAIGHYTTTDHDMTPCRDVHGYLRFVSKLCSLR